jgi:hypothetical protein
MKNAHGDLARKVMIARAALSGPATARHLFADLTMDMPDPGPALAWIAAYDPDETHARRAFEAMNVPALRATPAMQDVIEEVLEDPDVPADRMVRLWVEAKKHGLEVVLDPETVGPEALLEAVGRFLTGALPQTFESLASSFSRRLGVSPRELEARFDMARRVGPPLGPSMDIVLAMVAHEHRYDEGACRDALQRAAASKDGRAATLMRAIASWPCLGGLKAVVDESVRAMTGIPGASWDAGGFHRAAIAGTDGDGRCLAMVIHQDVRGRAPLTSAVLGAAGMVMVKTTVVDRASLVSRILPRRVASVPIGLVRSLAQEAMLHYERSGAPMPGVWALTVPFLGELRPAPHVPDLSAYGDDRPDASESGRLIRSSTYRGWYCRSSEAFDFVREGRRDVLGAAYLQEICCTEAERARLLRAFRRFLEIEAIAGRADHPINRIAWRTCLALAEGMPLVEMPFIQHLAVTSKLAVQVWVRDGFRNGEEALRAQLREEGLA